MLTIPIMGNLEEPLGLGTDFISEHTALERCIEELNMRVAATHDVCLSELCSHVEPASLESFRKLDSALLSPISILDFFSRKSRQRLRPRSVESAVNALPSTLALSVTCIAASDYATDFLMCLQASGRAEELSFRASEDSLSPSASDGATDPIGPPTCLQPCPARRKLCRIKKSYTSKIGV
jgi:hypothetical protein